MDGFSNLEAYWIWLGLGVLLAALEIAVPGTYLIWLAAAALITGGATFALGLALPLQILLFAFAAIVTVYAGRQYIRDNPIRDADPLLNRRIARLRGEVAVVTQAIEDGSGRVKVGDSEWMATGADAAVGTKVRIAGGTGSKLAVEPLGGTALPPE